MQSAVLGHAVRPDVGALDLPQREALDRRDGDPRDAGFAGGGLHRSMLTVSGSTTAPAALPRARQAVAPTGSGRTTTVSATAMISSTGRSADEACLRIASGLAAS